MFMRVKISVQILILMVVMFVLCTGNLQGQSINLLSTHDVAIDPNNHITTYDDTRLETTYSNFPTFAATRRVLLQFDLSTQTEALNGALLTLNLVENNLAAGSSVTLALYATDDGWDESSVTWANQPTTGNLLQSITVDAGFTGAISFSQPAIGAYLEAQRTGDQIASFLLQLDGGSGNLGFGGNLFFEDHEGSHDGVNGNEPRIEPRLVVNNPPVAQDDRATTDEDTAVTLSPLDNDSDPDNDPLTLLSFTAPTQGNVLQQNHQLTFTPATDQSGLVTFTYTVGDGSLSATAIVTVTVNPINDPPVATDDQATTDEDQVVTIAVLQNDADVDSATLAISQVGASAQGSVSQENAALRFTPAANFNGTAVFTYSVSDGALTAIGTVNVIIQPVNDPPQAINDQAVTAEDTPVELAVLANDLDVDGDTLVIDAVGSPSVGTVNAVENRLTYTPPAAFSGQATFTYTVSDGQAAAQALVTVTVNAVNDPPVAGDDTAQTDEDTPLLIAVLANDLDPEGAPLQLSAVDTGGVGSAVIQGDQLAYQPPPNFHGTVPLTYTVSDGELSAQANVIVTIAPINDAPVANADEANTAEDNPVVIAVLTNDSDVDGDGLHIAAVGSTPAGAVTTDGNSITFTLAPNLFGTATFTYAVSDGDLTGGATVTVQISAVNDAPVAQNDTATTNQNSAVVIPVLANDQDPDGDSLTISAINNVTHGTAQIEGNSLRFTPEAAFQGLATLSYTITDGSLTSTADVTIQVNAVSASCQLYPIALHESSLAAAAVGDLITNIAEGQTSGNFGWLSWTGANNLNTLVASLTPPGNSHAYVNPDNGNDHTLSVGDWVRGVPGTKNGQALRNALDQLKTQDIVLPVWANSQGQGANLRYQVVTFALVRLTDYQLPGKNRLSLRFLGYQSCTAEQAQSNPPDFAASSGQAEMRYTIFLPMISQNHD